MMDCNKKMVAASKAVDVFLKYIKDRDYEKPLYEQELSSDAPDEAKVAFENYKNYISLERQAS